jgi:DNA (cytosine-5)-methyltransferase 1
VAATPIRAGRQSDILVKTVTVSYQMYAQAMTILKHENDLNPSSAVAVASSIDLFAGGGGLALGMSAAGFRHVLVVERDLRACSTLLANAARPFASDDPGSCSVHDRWPLVQGDIREVDFSPWRGAVGVVAGGVPCQPWSVAGVHQGYDDPRNLWPELLRCVRETRPQAVIAENVRGLLRPTFRPYYEYILRSLAAPFDLRADGEDWYEHDQRIKRVLQYAPGDPSERYSVTYRLVNAADYGVPQVRWRVFVVAFRRDLGISGWKFPGPTHAEAVLLRSQTSGEYWARHGIKRSGAATAWLPGLEEQLAPWRTVRDAIRDLPSPMIGIDHSDWLHHVGWPCAHEYPGHTPNDLDRPAKTIKAGVHGVPGGEGVVRLDDGSIRNLTVREAARIMTFPDHWWLSGPRSEQMRQLGNAVPVMLGRAITESIARALKFTSQS